MESGYVVLAHTLMPTSPLIPRAPKPSTPKPPPPPTIMRTGRKYPNTPNCSYPLPCDVRELSRQTLWHELSREVYGSSSSVEFKKQSVPLPERVLDLGCGTGIWSATMSEEFTALGKKDVAFVGLDVVDVCMGMDGVDFTFVKHDIMVLPLPFPDNSFDFVFARDVMLCMAAKAMYSGIISEILRILKPGGIFENQCSDYYIRTIQRTASPYIPGSSCYEIASLKTQFSPTSDNPYITQWNERIKRTLEKRDLSSEPCTIIGPALVMEDGVIGVTPRRYALPLDTIWWESEPGSESASSTTSSKRRSTGGSSVESLAGSRRRGGATRRSSVSADSADAGSPLTEDERAVRHLGRLTFVQLIEALEPAIREACEIPIEEWDAWYREMMWSWFEGRGLRGGECLELGAWWARKRA